MKMQIYHIDHSCPYDTLTKRVEDLSEFLNREDIKIIDIKFSMAIKNDVEDSIIDGILITYEEFKNDEK